MTRTRHGNWSLAFLAIMAIGVAAAIYHASSGRWGNALMAAGASLMGTVVIILMQRHPEQSIVADDVAPRQSPRRAWHELISGAHNEPDRSHWLNGSILAGFLATIAMSMLLVIAYTTVGFIGDQNGSQLSQWFWHLSHNDLIDGVWDIPMAAFSINLLAGLGWALIYGGIVERRMSGPGWMRGMLFSLLPWLLSLVVFFPAIGGGIFGSQLNAGPLPAIGNLALHLVYGTILGAVYAIPEMSSNRIDTQSARTQNEGTAIGLVSGLTIGLVAGATIAAFAATDVHDGINITLAGGGIGILLGGLIGSFAGVNAGTHQELR